MLQVTLFLDQHAVTCFTLNSASANRKQSHSMPKDEIQTLRGCIQAIRCTSQAEADVETYNSDTGLLPDWLPNPAKYEPYTEKHIAAEPRENKQQANENLGQED